ncbi:hypothetical protein O3P69_001163 [Scylla paramamosain]|uniref:Diacylglycerol O-acyltransferase n=1 Tax=Scylla paramamosain TaxID=85552 RepID=A0AAW0UQZ1_SCYPA
MAVFPMERHMYSWMLDNATRPLSGSFQPLALPPETTALSWLEVLGQHEFLLLPALQNMPLALLVLLVPQVSTGSPKKLLSPLKRLVARVFLFHLLLNVVKAIVGLVLMLALLPVMFPFMAFFAATSILVRVCYAVLWGPSVKKVEGLDCVWGVEEEENKPFITVCLRVHGAPDLHAVQQAILTKILQVRDDYGEYKYKKFRQLFSQRCGYYCWRDDCNFDINNHVREIELSSLLPTPASQDAKGEDEAAAGEERQKGNDDATDEVLQWYVSEELTKAMPEDKPQWEVLLVARGDGRYNVLLRLHHAIGDGVTLVRLCVEALVDTPLPRPPVGAPPPGPIVRAVMTVWSLMMLPFGILKVAANFDRNCLHGLPLSGRKLMTWSRGMPLGVLRQVKNKASTTINDVLMTCLSAALAKHFTRRKEEPKKVTVVVPVSFHDPHEPLTLTNLFSIATVKLPVSKALAPHSRLAVVKEVLDDTKRDPTLGAVYWVVKATSEILPAPVASFLFNSQGITLCASNVPGPQQEITIWGDRVEDLVFWVPNRGPVGVGVSFFSYKGTVKIGLNVDLALFHSTAEAKLLLEDMEEELKLLHRRLLPQG